MPQLTGFAPVPIPGPTPWPLIGTQQKLFQFLEDPIGAVRALQRYGEVAAVVDKSPAIVCVFGAERIREVLSNPALFRHDEEFTKGPPGSSMNRYQLAMISVNGEVHKRHRRLMMPAFQKAALDGYAAEITATTRAVLNTWPMDQTADLDVLFRDLALCMAVRAFFGLDVLQGATRLGHTAAAFFKLLTDPLVIMAPLDLPGMPYRRALRLGAEVITELESLVEKKRATAAQDRDALSMLLRAVDEDGSGFSKDELVAEASTLFFAGHETTAKTLGWTLFLLERHPDVLALVLDEIDAVLGDRAPTPDDLPRMPRMDQVIKESMRVLTPVPLLFLRVCAEEAPVGPFRLPKGANVLISPFTAHQDPALYPEPRRFLPERWASLQPPPYTYMPFGAGPRTCVGALFAAQALRLMMPMILRHARYSMIPGTRVSRLTRGNTLFPRYGLPMRIERPHRRRVAPTPIRGDIGELVELRG